MSLYCVSCLYQAVGGYLVYPIPNSMVIFPGHWLHGVLPVAETQTENEQQTDRITLLMNIWGEQLQDPSCLTLTDEHTESRDMQHRYGSPVKLTSTEIESHHISHIALHPLSADQITELVDFDLQQYINAEEAEADE